MSEETRDPERRDRIAKHYAIATEKLEGSYPGDLKLGSRGSGVKRLQEWLWFHYNTIVIDGVFGTQTESILDNYIEHSALTEAIWNTLTDEFRSFHNLGRFSEDQLTVPPPEMLRVLALDSLHWDIAEIPPNRGPWVRTFNQRDGVEQAWCAGFVSYLIRQVSCIIHDENEFKYPNSVRCDELAKWGVVNGVFRHGWNDDIGEGAVFLVPSPTQFEHWIHTGIVVDTSNPDFITTVEGNSNEDGGREGTRVVLHQRQKNSVQYLKTVFV